jgi:flagellar hook-basal body complex protein FliE
MDLFRELDEATKEHTDAERAESEARSVLTAAVNRLNKAQQAIDKAMAAMKAKAPWNTDWHSQRNPGQPV